MKPFLAVVGGVVGFGAPIWISLSLAVVILTIAIVIAIIAGAFK
jgi:hypothetical protein